MNNRLLLCSGVRKADPLYPFTPPAGYKLVVLTIGSKKDGKNFMGYGAKGSGNGPGDFIYGRITPPPKDDNVEVCLTHNIKKNTWDFSAGNNENGVYYRGAMYSGDINIYDSNVIVTDWTSLVGQDVWVAVPEQWYSPHQ